jgi:hypothetical protein
MFLDKTKKRAPERSFSLGGYKITHKYKTRLDKSAKNKHFSLWAPFVSHEKIKVL